MPEQFQFKNGKLDVHLAGDWPDVYVKQGDEGIDCMEIEVIADGTEPLHALLDVDYPGPFTLDGKLLPTLGLPEVETDFYLHLNGGSRIVGYCTLNGDNPISVARARVWTEMQKGDQKQHVEIDVLFPNPDYSPEGFTTPYILTRIEGTMIPIPEAYRLEAGTI